MAFGHLVVLPLHPALVHFPVALLSLTWLFGLVWHATGTERWGSLATTLEWIALAFVPFTMVAGVVDAGGFDFLVEPDWTAPLIWHFLCSVATAILFAAHAFWRRSVSAAAAAGRGTGTPHVWVDLGLTATGFWLLMVTGLIAAEMVFG